jgi:hypothetical protein
MGEARPARLTWRVVTPALAAGMAVLVLAGVFVRRTPPPAPSAPRATGEVPRTLEAATPAEAPHASAIAPAPARATALSTVRASAPGRRVREGPLVLVDPAQQAALLRFVAHLHRQKRPAALVAPALAAALTEPAPIVIEPLDVAPLADAAHDVHSRERTLP